MRFGGITVLFLAVAALASSASARSACDVPPGTDALWSKPETHFVLFGEIHGTAESPKLFGEVVCTALRSGKTVIAALEIPQRRQFALDAYLNSQGSPVDRRMLMGLVFQDAPQDGRASRAMADLIERLRVLRQEGAPLRLWAFKPEFSSAPFEQSRYEAAMSERLAAAPQASSTLVLALVGDLHARINTDAYGANLAFAPMGSYLPRAATRAVDLVGVQSGTAWNCQVKSRGEKTECGVHPMSFAPGSRHGLTIFAEPQNGFDAALGFDRPTASPPAMAAGGPAHAVARRKSD